jgi:hypothetical protein
VEKVLRITKSLGVRNLHGGFGSTHAPAVPHRKAYALGVSRTVELDVKTVTTHYVMYDRVGEKMIVTKRVHTEQSSQLLRNQAVRQIGEVHRGKAKPLTAIVSWSTKLLAMTAWILHLETQQANGERENTTGRGNLCTVYERKRLGKQEKLASELRQRKIYIFRYSPKFNIDRIMDYHERLLTCSSPDNDGFLPSRHRNRRCQL